MPKVVWPKGAGGELDCLHTKPFTSSLSYTMQRPFPKLDYKANIVTDWLTATIGEQ